MLFRNPLRFAANAALVTALALAAGCGGESDSTGADSFPSAAFATVNGDAGKLVIEVRTAPTQPPGRGLTDVELRVATPAGAPVDGLELTALPWMPDMGHGASVKPSVAPDGDGRYLVTNVEMFMPGRWELRLQTTGAVEDSAKVSFQIP
ncbi:MAG: FixH family protein [Polyangiaceae bacterium]